VIILAKPLYRLYPEQIKPGTRKYARFRFWRWYLTTAVLNLFDVENMEQDMETSFKLSVLLGGRAVFFRKQEKVWCLPFADGGEVPIYYGEIIKVLVANPVLGEFTGTPGKDCQCVYLTPLDRVQLGTGFSLLIDETAEALADNDLSVRCVQFAKRIPTVFVGHTDPERIGMEAVSAKIDDGDPKLIVQSPLARSIERLDSGSNNTAPLSEFTEYQQYKLGTFYTMLGVNSPWNTKRERVQAAENDANSETARYNIADIVENLNLQLDAVNVMFDTDYHVNLTLIKSAEIDAEIQEKTQPEEVQNNAVSDTPANDEPSESGGALP
jgi:hypothetical protein